MRLLYTLIIRCYYLAVLIASLWNDKAKKWINGRKDILDTLMENSCDEHPVVFHCASLGEFEQGKPLMERMKKEDPSLKIWVTFFSPSGYEIRKNDSVADAVTYLPLDTPYYAKKFVEIVNPQKVFFVKYEYWFNLMAVLHDRNIPFYYVSAIFRPGQIFFKNSGKWFAKQLHKAACFFVQNKRSEQLLRQIGIGDVEITGDTRFDRVYEIASKQIHLDFVEEFATDAKLIVGGSTWAPDEKLLALLLSALKKNKLNYKMIIAPHLIDENHIEEVVSRFKDFDVVRYTEMDEHSLVDAEVMIVDQIGMLSRIFRYSNISYVGGAFETGLHNILEPAVYGVPLFFGPEYDKFNEAVELVALKGAFAIRRFDEMFDKIKDYEKEPDVYRKTCGITKGYVQQNLGSVDKIMNKINK